MTIDLTGIATSGIAGIFAVLAVVLPLLINARVKNSSDAATLDAAIGNSLGAIEQAAATSITTLKPSVAIPGIPPALAPGVQYALDHAGAEAASAMKTTAFTSLPAYLADKISARIGLAKIAAAKAVSPVLAPGAPVVVSVPTGPLVPRAA